MRREFGLPVSLARLKDNPFAAARRDFPPKKRKFFSRTVAVLDSAD